MSGVVSSLRRFLDTEGFFSTDSLRIKKIAMEERESVLISTTFVFVLLIFFPFEGKIFLIKGVSHTIRKTYVCHNT